MQVLNAQLASVSHGAPVLPQRGFAQSSGGVAVCVVSAVGVAAAGFAEGSYPDGGEEGGLRERAAGFEGAEGGGGEGGGEDGDEESGMHGDECRVETRKRWNERERRIEIEQRLTNCKIVYELID
jgi:hypothetical protein